MTGLPGHERAGDGVGRLDDEPLVDVAGPDRRRPGDLEVVAGVVAERRADQALERARIRGSRPHRRRSRGRPRRAPDRRARGFAAPGRPGRARSGTRRRRRGPRGGSAAPRAGGRESHDAAMRARPRARRPIRAADPHRAGPADAVRPQRRPDRRHDATDAPTSADSRRTSAEPPNQRDRAAVRAARRHASVPTWSASSRGSPRPGPGSGCPPASRARAARDRPPRPRSPATSA